MATLHILSKSPDSSDCLDSCLAVIAPDDALILIADGVYAALSPYSERLTPLRCYALTADLAARGLDERVAAHCHAIDDAGFVELSTQYQNSQSWF